MVSQNADFAQSRQGLRDTPTAYASIVAALTTTTLYQITPGRQARITKIIATNRTGGNGFLRFGYGAFTQVFPDLLMLAGIDMEWTEEELPEYWYRDTGSGTTDIVMQSTVGAASPTDVQVFAEIEQK